MPNLPFLHSAAGGNPGKLDTQPGANDHFLNAQKDDARLIRTVIGFLGWFAILGLGGIIFLLTVLIWPSKNATPIEATHASIVTALFTLIGSAVGGLSSMLASTRSSIQTPQQNVLPSEPVGGTTKSITVSGPDEVPHQEAGGSQTVTFTAQAVGLTSATVTWSVTGPSGTANDGTIDANTGVYTPPPAAVTAVVITATSTEDPNVKGTKTINVT